MRNRILSLTRNTIPYVKEIMPLAGSVTGCILMQQLDYWFEKYPDGFYKFQDSAPNHHLYKPGESWTEELGFTLTEFRGAFDRIGIRHKSKSEWFAKQDKFQGKFYCCYTDKRAGVTYYFRNHDLMDEALDAIVSQQNKATTPQSGPNGAGNRPKNEQKSSVFSQKPHLNAVSTKSLSTVNKETQSTVNDKTSSTGNEETSITGDTVMQLAGNDESASSESTKSDLREMTNPKTDITKTTLSKITKEQQQHQAGRPSGSRNTAATLAEKNRGGEELDLENLFYPINILAAERQALIALMEKCDPDLRQDVLDEVEGARLSNTLRSGVIPFARFLVEATEHDKFSLTKGVAIQAARGEKANKAALMQTLESRADRMLDVKPASGYSDAELDKLPEVIRKRMSQLRDKEQQPGAE